MIAEQDIVRASHDLDEVIYRCLLNEVFLLLDFISGRYDRTLGCLNGMADPAQLGKVMTSAETLAMLSRIRYPPELSENNRARDATVLLQAKDRLNTAARPATGLSVAYTFMFAGGAAIGSNWHTSRLAAFGRRTDNPGRRSDCGEDAPGSGAAGGGDDPISRTTLAVNAYPGLISGAKWFRLIWKVMLLLALAVVLLSVWVSYEAALGRSLMLRFDALDQQKTDFSVRIYAAEQSLSVTNGTKVQRLCPDPDPPKPADQTPGGQKTNEQASGGQDNNNQVSVSVEQQQLCDTYSDWKQKNKIAYYDLRNYLRTWPIHALTPRSAEAEAEAIKAEASSKPNTPASIIALCFVEKGKPATQQIGTNCKPAEPEVSEQLAASVLTAFSTSILPVLFGLLGATAAMVRSVYGHVRQRTLTPRELNLALIRLPLGLVAGVSVRLLFSPNVASIQGSAGLAGGLTLSASSIAFLAGYGVEAVFGVFDGLLKRLFTLELPDPASLPADCTTRERQTQS